MKTPSDYSIDLAYSYDNPQDLKRYYNDSAKEYDDFVDSVNYVLPARVVEAAKDYFKDQPERVIDVGCGTGLVGVEMAKQFSLPIMQGVDISPEMIYKSYDKRKEDGSRCYSTLILADVTRKASLQSNHYGLMVSAGTFTVGHLKPMHFVYLLDSLVDGGLGVVSIKEDHYEKENFLGMFVELDRDIKAIKLLELRTVDSYDNPEYSANSVIAIFQKTGL